jgi:hypothetical protein
MTGALVESRTFFKNSAVVLDRQRKRAPLKTDHWLDEVME